MRFRHYALLTGLLMFVFSFLFIAGADGVYRLLLFAGLLISLFFLLYVLFSSDTWKLKVMWLGITVAFVGINFLAQGFLVDVSCRLYLWQHEDDIEKVKTILLPKDGEIRVDRNDTGSDSLLSRSERADMKQLLWNLDVPYIWRADNSIHIVLWGFLDSRFGLFYFETPPEEGKPYHLIAGNWYR